MYPKHTPSHCDSHMNVTQCTFVLPRGPLLWVPFLSTSPTALSAMPGGHISPERTHARGSRPPGPHQQPVVSQGDQNEGPKCSTKTCPCSGTHSPSGHGEVSAVLSAYWASSLSLGARPLAALLPGRSHTQAAARAAGRAPSALGFTPKGQCRLSGGRNITNRVEVCGQTETEGQVGSQELSDRRTSETGLTG